jgi:hypothetical protein
MPQKRRRFEKKKKKKPNSAAGFLRDRCLQSKDSPVMSPLLSEAPTLLEPLCSPVKTMSSTKSTMKAKTLKARSQAGWIPFKHARQVSSSYKAPASSICWVSPVLCLRKPSYFHIRKSAKAMEINPYGTKQHPSVQLVT